MTITLPLNLQMYLLVWIRMAMCLSMGHHLAYDLGTFTLRENKYFLCVWRCVIYAHHLLSRWSFSCRKWLDGFRGRLRVLHCQSIITHNEQGSDRVNKDISNWTARNVYCASLQSPQKKPQLCDGRNIWKKTPSVSGGIIHIALPHLTLILMNSLSPYPLDLYRYG